MPMMTGARTWVELPAPVPLGGGVLSVANVVDVPDGDHRLMGVEALTDACSSTEIWSEWCTMTPTARKIFEDTQEHVVGDPFVLYAGVSCDLQRLDEGADRAKSRLGYGESRGVDQYVDAFLSDSTDVVDLGGPFDFDQAVGAAEAFAATWYGGQPTLLIPRLFIQCGCSNGALRTNLDGTLTTCAGSKVAPLTTAVTVPITITTGTIYVSGSVTVYRGPVKTISVPQQIDDLGPTFAPMRALAERVYVPVFDCLVAKVEVSCS
jgi:hypothetical protein